MSEHRDPAVEAAQRAERESRWWESGNQTAWDTDYAEAAAREALAVLRPLIADARTWTPYATRDIGDAYPADTVHDLLDDLSDLIYTSEELNR